MVKITNKTRMRHRKIEKTVTIFKDPQYKINSTFKKWYKNRFMQKKKMF
mgnify:CR=1 FL=1